MHILCWDSTVLGKERIHLEEHLPLCSGIVNCFQALGWGEVLVLLWGAFGVLQLAKVT